MASRFFSKLTSFMRTTPTTRRTFRKTNVDASQFMPTGSSRSLHGNNSNEGEANQNEPEGQAEQLNNDIGNEQEATWYGDVSHWNSGVEGSTLPWYSEEHESHITVRFDLTGVNDAGIKIRRNDNAIHVEAQEVISKQEFKKMKARKYSFGFIFHGPLIMDEMTYVIENGTLRIFIPKSTRTFGMVTTTFHPTPN